MAIAIEVVAGVTIKSANLSTCANFRCTNKPTQGGFALVTIDTSIVSKDALPIELFLCMPCAKNLQAWAQEKEKSDH